MGMFESLTVGLVLAAVSGLTFFAYRHPDAYGRLYGAAMGSVAVLYIGTVIWDVSMSYTYRQLLPLLQQIEQVEVFSEKHSQIELPMFELFFVQFFTQLYLFFLRVLHLIVGTK